MALSDNKSKMMSEIQFKNILSGILSDQIKRLTHENNTLTKRLIDITNDIDHEIQQLKQTIENQKIQIFNLKEEQITATNQMQETFRQQILRMIHQRD